MAAIFDFSNHYEVLHNRLDGKQAPRGSKTRFAEFLRVQPAYLSQVLARKYSLSLEQADLANEFFDHSPSECEFFLLLVSHDRAGTQRLRAHFARQIEAALRARSSVIDRLGRKPEVSAEARGVYYSSWIYAAIHVACTVKQLRTRQAIASALALPAALVGEVLDFLCENLLVRRDGDGYVATESWIRLEKNSPHIVKHHANWRQRAIQSLEFETDKELHYSGVFSLDAATAAAIKEEGLQFLQRQTKQIAAAPEEGLYAIGLDFFQVTRK